MPNYFYTNAAGQKQGPINEQLLKELIAHGIIVQNTSMETDNGYSGVAGVIPGLFDVGPVSPPSSPPASGGTGGARKTSLAPLLIGLVLLAVVLSSVAATVWFLKSPSRSSYANIFEAAREGTVADVKYFVNQGDNINAKDAYGRTPILLAVCCNRDIGVVKYLFEKGANVNVGDYYGRTPLHYAASIHDDAGVLKYLVNKETDVNVEDSDGRTPLHYAAATNENIAVLKYLIEKGADVNAKSNCILHTPLHLAIGFNGNIAVIQFLIKNGANVNDDEGVYTPLHIAANVGGDTLKYILSAGADVNLPAGDDSDSFLNFFRISTATDLAKGEAAAILRAAGGKTYAELTEPSENSDPDPPEDIFEAADKGSVADIERFLKQKISIDVKDSFGRTPLYYAIDFGNPDVAKYLIKKGANIHEKANEGKTSLHFAAKCFNVDVAKDLIKKGAKVHAQTDSGETALHSAAEGSPSIAKYLISVGAEVNTKNNEGETPLDKCRKAEGYMPGYASITSVILLSAGGKYADELD